MRRRFYAVGTKKGCATPFRVMQPFNVKSISACRQRSQTATSPVPWVSLVAAAVCPSSSRMFGSSWGTKDIHNAATPPCSICYYCQPHNSVPLSGAPFLCARWLICGVSCTFPDFISYLCPRFINKNSGRGVWLLSGMFGQHAYSFFASASSSLVSASVTLSGMMCQPPFSSLYSARINCRVMVGW